MSVDAADNAAQSRLMTVSQVAGVLGKSERTIRRYILAGKLPTIDIGGIAHVQMAGIEAPGEVLAYVRDGALHVDQPSVPRTVDAEIMPGSVTGMFIDTLKQQLAVKDSQISDLDRRNRELTETISRLALPMPGNTSSPPTTQENAAAPIALPSSMAEQKGRDRSGLIIALLAVIATALVGIGITYALSWIPM